MAVAPGEISLMEYIQLDERDPEEIPIFSDKQLELITRIMTLDFMKKLRSKIQPSQRDFRIWATVLQTIDSCCDESLWEDK
jgi:hypothetical protein